MKKSLILLFIALNSLITFNTFANNRITGPADRAARCMNAGVNDVVCEVRRKEALKDNCITQEEYDTLLRYGAFPVCSKFGTGLDSLMSWCPCGCFAPDTKISVQNRQGQQFEERADLISANTQQYLLEHLTADSFLSESTAQPTQFYTEFAPIRLSTAGQEPHELVVIELENGVKLRLTQRHPVLTFAGKMVFARDLKVNDVLTTKQGSPVLVTTLKYEKFTGDVVNFSTEKNKIPEHVIFAEGVAVGDQFWQASLEDQINRVFIRK